MNLKRNKKGLSLLLIVVIIGSSALIMVLGSTFLGVGEANTSYVHNKGAEVKALADGCAELALEELRNDDTYSGDSLSVGNGSCIMSVSASINDRTIMVTSTIDDVSANAVVEANVVSNIVTLTSWE